jgi:hypothetical protein
MHPNRTLWRTLAALFIGVLPVITVACGDDEPASDATATTEAVTTGEASATTGGSSATTVADGSAGTVDANEADVDELAAAFSAAGVPNAERWAHEVEEYRPYSDDGWAHLRQELSKYNIDDATFQKIVSTLSL